MKKLELQGGCVSHRLVKKAVWGWRLTETPYSSADAVGISSQLQGATGLSLFRSERPPLLIQEGPRGWSLRQNINHPRDPS